MEVFDFAVFANPQTWVQLLTLIFLEMVLGIDNLVFIAITTDRLPDDRKVLGRRFGLIAALVMRIVLLCFASWIISLHLTLFTLPFTIPGTDPHISGRDLILLVGGAYLIVKGIQELVEKISAAEVEACGDPAAQKLHQIGLVQAIGTIAMMDIIFSLDSVITAVGMVDVLLVMILAVMIAVIVMIVFANPISEFINRNHEVKILALAFIVAVGFKLVAESLGIELHIEGTEIEALDIILYFAMFFALILAALQMVYHHNAAKAQCRLSAPDAESGDGQAAQSERAAQATQSAQPGSPRPDDDTPPR
ncbi:MAG: TerC family protein [Coriobacteriales bacterium]|nr:TerC family protein [Coriobacteriales bacterium]